MTAPPVDCPVDIIFVVDESTSIRRRNFDKVKTFLSKLIGRLDIDSGKTRVGLVTFSTRVGHSVNLTMHMSVDSLQMEIMSLRYGKGTTNTAAALRHVRTRMLTPAAGDRPNVPNVVVVLTDGDSNSQSATRVSLMIL